VCFSCRQYYADFGPTLVAEKLASPLVPNCFLNDIRARLLAIVLRLDFATIKKAELVLNLHNSRTPGTPSTSDGYDRHNQVKVV
jgi:hypothetical protein